MKPVMKAEMKPNVDPSSAEFEAGVEAGLNSTKDTTNWQAGNHLGQELKDGGEHKHLGSESPVKGASIPLFMRHAAGGHGSPQDEKDEAAE